MQNKLFLSQQSKEKWNKIKIGISTAMFLMQYFCLYSLLLFSKLYPKIESTWPTTKCRRRKSFACMWYYIVPCCRHYVSFPSRLKAIVFPKLILKSKACDQSIQGSKKLFCHKIVKNYLCNILWKFLPQNWRHVEAWNQRTGTPADFTALLHSGRTVRSSHQRCSIRKLFLKILQYP